MVRLANLHRFRGQDEPALALYTLAARWRSDDAAGPLERWGKPVPAPDLYLALRRNRQQRGPLQTARDELRDESGAERYRRYDDYLWAKRQCRDRTGEPGD